MTANAWFLQRLADILGERVEVARHPETTALGAAFLAGQACGLYGSHDELQRAWVPSRAFEPAMSEIEREARYGGWRDALAKVRSRP
jgi:glycerol kinase